MATLEPRRSKPKVSANPVDRVAAGMQARNKQRMTAEGKSRFDSYVKGLTSKERNEFKAALERLDKMAAERYVASSKAAKNKSRPSAASSTKK